LYYHAGLTATHNEAASPGRSRVYQQQPLSDLKLQIQTGNELSGQIVSVTPNVTDTIPEPVRGVVATEQVAPINEGRCPQSEPKDTHWLSGLRTWKVLNYCCFLLQCRDADSFDALRVRATSVPWVLDPSVYLPDCPYSVREDVYRIIPAFVFLVGACVSGTHALKPAVVSGRCDFPMVPCCAMLS
jgi:hypothetical protein